MQKNREASMQMREVWQTVSMTRSFIPSQGVGATKVYDLKMSLKFTSKEACALNTKFKSFNLHMKKIGLIVEA